MKFNSSLIALSIGLTIAIASYANAASATVVLNGSNLTSKVSPPKALTPSYQPLVLEISKHQYQQL